MNTKNGPTIVIEQEDLCKKRYRLNLTPTETTTGKCRDTEINQWNHCNDLYVFPKVKKSKKQDRFEQRDERR